MVGFVWDGRSWPQLREMLTNATHLEKEKKKKKLVSKIFTSVQQA